VPGLRHALCLAAVKVARRLASRRVASCGDGLTGTLETMDTRIALELWSLVSPPTSASMVVRSPDGVVIEVKAWTNGHTGDDGYSG
jgi:hypothetical protein